MDAFVVHRTVVVVLLALSVAVASGASAAKARMVDIPYLDKVAIDGSAADWGDRGFRVSTMGVMDGTWRTSTADFAPAFRLGWNKDGLVLFARVLDDHVAEADDISAMYMKDCVEVWTGVNGKEMSSYQVAIGTGADPRYPKARTSFWDRRANKDSMSALTIQVATGKIPGGYTIEALLPWKNLGISPKDGDTVGFQIVFDEYDREDQTYQQGIHAIWNPTGDTNWATGMFAVRLSGTASAPVMAAGTGSYEYCRRAKIQARASDELVGKQISLKHGKRTLGTATVVKDEDGWGKAEFMLPMPPVGKPYEGLTIVDGTACIGSVQMSGDPDMARARALQDANLRFDPFVFDSPSFPRCDFVQPLLAEEVIGPYKIKCTFYDSEYNVVTSAAKPGRYGAVVKVIPENGGRTLTRFHTLFRSPEPLEWWNYKMNFAVDLPKQLGIDPEVVKEQPGPVSEMFKWSCVDDLSMSSLGSVVLAGLFETKPGATATSGAEDPFLRDRQWWVTLKRKLYGYDKRSPMPFVSPKQFEGKPATVVHEGSLQEAGMKPDAAQTIDKLLQEWTANTEEPFAVCVVRHGVIVLHKAYGTRDGKPMTVDTPSWMASNTKTLSANLMWMLMDQGMVNIEDQVAKYLPPLAEVKVARPLTIRHLYMHTNGFPLMDHWGDEMNDLEDVVASYYPYLKIQQAQRYNGVGYAIGGKIVELFTGESIPAAYKKHLLGPLGLAHTEVTGTYGDARSVPLDMAKVAQLMLNKGAYGNTRFYSKETFEKMLPVDLNRFIPADAPTTTADRKWGIGLMNYEGEGLGQGTFGHGAASGATLRIDPVNDLIIVMTRNTTGRNYEKYHQKFIDAVVAGIAKD